jgi:(S)-2-hydroxyglutarate dehydrogenase
MTVHAFDYLVIGAGIVGLTTALELKKRFPNSTIAIIEKEAEIGLHASGRNSGVMHSGVYYGNSTLKAKVCSVGAKRMREFAAEHQIACHKTGKVIIATSERDLPTIEKLMKNAQDNHVRAELLTESEIKKIEPYASPYKLGIHSPDTAVIDSKAVIKKLFEMLTKLGAVFFFNAKNIAYDVEKTALKVNGKRVTYGFLFNCAGAGADLVAKQFGLAQDYTLVPFKGIYYKIRAERDYLVKSNIYPVPDIDLPFLGVHLTRVVSGDIYVGPTAIPALGRENYGVLKGMEFKESFKIGKDLISMYLENKQNFRLLVHTEVKKYLKPWFVQAAQKLMHDIQSDDLVPCDKVGIRPQLINNKTKTLEMDYILQGTESSLHVLNAISPAFTSSFAFAEFIVETANIT